MPLGISIHRAAIASPTARKTLTTCSMLASLRKPISSVVKSGVKLTGPRLRCMMKLLSVGCLVGISYEHRAQSGRTAEAPIYTLGPRQYADANANGFANNPTGVTRYTGNELRNCNEMHTRINPSQSEGPCRQEISLR